MIKLKNLITEEWLTHKGKTMWFPAHTNPTMDMISMRDHIALYPTQMEKMFGKEEIALQQKIKNTIDTRNLLNPGNGIVRSKVLKKLKIEILEL